MDGFFVLLGLMAIIGLFLGPIGFFLTLGARERLREAAGQISRLEARVKRLEAGGPRTGPLPEAIETPEGEAETIEEPAPEPAPEPEVAPVSPPARTAAALPGAPPARETAADIPDMTFGGPPVGARTPAPEPAPSRSLEELLGTRWTVWVGGVALCIGALMLVRYSIELGFFGPGVRILMALALSAALVGAGEWMRRSDREGAAGSAYIPGVLTAAGAVSAFGAIYAAWALYGFIGPATAFVALGATGVACMFAAALHGPALAGLGLIGSLVTPLVVQTNEPNPWALTIYLAVVSAAAYGLARLRLWLWLAAATAVGEGIWAFGYIGSFGRGDIVNFFQAGAAHVLVAAALAGWFICVGPWRNADAEKTPLDPVAVLVPAGFAFIAHVLLFAGAHHGQFGTGWIFVATLMTLLLAGIGLTSAPAVAVAAIAGLFVVATLRIWPGSFATDMAWRLPDWRLDTWVEPVNVGAYAGFALVGAFGVAALCAWRLLSPARASFFAVCAFAGTATVTPLVALLVSWLRFGMSSANYTFAALAAALGAVFVTAAQVFRNRLGEAPAGERPAAVELGLGAFASATIAALALALVFALDGGTLTIALALSALGAAWVSTQLRIPALRWCVAALGVVVAARLAWEPRIVGAALGKTIVFNWLLAGYGVPAAAFGYAARLMRRASGVEDAPVQIGQALAILLSGFLVMFEIRHALHDGDIFAPASGLVEQGLLAFCGFAYAATLTRIEAARSSLVFRVASYLLFVGTIVVAALALGLGVNPLFHANIRVEGGPVFNTLVLGYLLPAVAALALSWFAVGVRPGWYLAAARVVTIALLFGYLTLETRFLFQGPSLYLTRHTSQPEWYAYSAVWLLLGLALLAWGLWRGSKESRLGSAFFVFLTVVKVFLFDLAGLAGLWRALSFIGLGFVLLGIGLVYQKLVFAKPKAAPDAGAPMV